MIIKIDMAKAFDRLEWSFVKFVLHFFKFPDSLITLILSCISTVTPSILINGTPTEYFSPSKGIRQGDLLSPYIFILYMDYLSLLITHVVSEKKMAPSLFRTFNFFIRAFSPILRWWYYFIIWWYYIIYNHYLQNPNLLL